MMEWAIFGKILATSGGSSTDFYRPADRFSAARYRIDSRAREFYAAADFLRLFSLCRDRMDVDFAVLCSPHVL